MLQDPNFGLSLFIQIDLLIGLILFLYAIFRLNSKVEEN